VAGITLRRVVLTESGRGRRMVVSDYQHRPCDVWGNSQSEMPKTALLCPPAYFDVIDRKSPYMVGASSVDKAKALAQWEGLRGALEAAGVKVETIEPVPGLEDMVFAANQVFVGAVKELGSSLCRAA
jgi:hypothetical protein